MSSLDPMAAYWRKLSSSIIASSVWSEAASTRLVWITMIALSDQNGHVLASVPGLARLAAVPISEAEEAIRVLSSPDPHDRSKVLEGRRIVPVDGGWFLVNFARYQDAAKSAADRARKREWWNKNRSTRRETRQSDGLARPLDRSESEKEKESESEKKDKYPPGFALAWDVYPHVKGRSAKREAALVWKRLGLEARSSSVLGWISCLRESEDWTKDGGKFVPGFQVWLKKHDFSETPGSPAVGSGSAPVVCTPDCPNASCGHRLSKHGPSGCGVPGCDCKEVG